jgi:hypothetical protein
MRKALMTRATAAVLAVAAFMPWYSSQAQVDHDTYLGNPLPWIDWLLLVAALAAVARPQIAVVAGAVGLVDVALGSLLMYGDAAEGLDVSLLPGLPLAAAASLALLILRPKANLPYEVVDDLREDGPSTAAQRP